MTARIARGGGPKPRPRAQGRGRSVSTRRKAPGLLESYGFAPGTGRRIGGWVLAGMLAAGAIAAILAFELPQRAGIAIGEGIGKAGFIVRRIEPRGLNRVAPMRVYELLDRQRNVPMPLVDLQAIRAELMQIGWIRDARVSRRLPDTLVVQVIEREPAAIWQRNQLLSLIDAEGVVVDLVRIEAMPDLPLIIGPQANRHYTELNALIATVPHLRPQVAGATWVSNRRWDIRFQTGELLSLPEGSEASGRAILNFARMDQQTQLLGRGFVRFDMRIPGRFIVRVSREPGSRVTDLGQPAAPAQGAPPQDLARTI